MIALQDLTVGQVSGMIAAAVFVVQFLVPIVLPIILLGLLRPRSAAVTESAVSWSVIGRFLHSSQWPVFLRTDSAATPQACKSALFISFFKTFMLVLLAVAAVVTPLGLYEGIVADGNSDPPAFYYIKDTSPMGYGTPPRDLNNTWSRLCGAILLKPCPNDNNRAMVVDNRTGVYVDYQDDWYDTKVPQKVVDVFQSGTADLGKSVSGSFDIQYRSYVKHAIDDTQKPPLIDNATARTVGNYQPLFSLLLSDDIISVEGLIVDLKEGGIGFRNHSAPAWREYGSTWTEDILFVVPDTVCVDTNLTIDFSVPRTNSELRLEPNGILRPKITDRGGFVNLNKTYPRWDMGDVQENPMLYYRAYRGAWLRNAYTMAYMNVTSLTNETTKTKAWAYLNSEFNKTFPLYYPNGRTAATSLGGKSNSLSIATDFGSYLRGTEGQSNKSTIGNQTAEYNFESKLPLYPNPFNINSSSWSSIDTLCRGQGGADLANITHIIAKCGVLFGAPRRQDNSPSVLFDPGSNWTLSMYSCMSTAKATIKTVTFRFNGTENDLSSLRVVSLEDKKYPNNTSKPLWGVENSEMFLKDGGPLWGLVSEESSKKLNITTVRKESLYLPGRDPVIGFQNMPGAEFAALALDMTYETGITSTGPVDYSGKTNLAMYRKWQELSKEAGSSAKILNLIWTDIAANMVVGTKGLESRENAKGKRDSASQAGQEAPKVTCYTRRVKYKYVYGIPAFLALVLAIASLVSTIFFMLFSGARPSTLRAFLQHTSAGRFLTSQSSSSYNAFSSHTAYGGHTPTSQSDTYSNEPTNVWVKGAGKQPFTLSAEGWSKSVQDIPGYETKQGAMALYAPVPNPNGY